MKIYTRVGDQGMTKQISGRMVPKTDAQIVALGDLDELESWLGNVVAIMGNTHTAERQELQDIQRKLYDLQADISVKRHQVMVPADTTRLETCIDQLTTEVPVLKAFILPGGTPTGAALQYARTVARRAERSVVRLNQEHPLEPAILTYLNRLSDFLFALARAMNWREGYQEVPSKPTKA